MKKEKYKIIIDEEGKNYNDDDCFELGTIQDSTGNVISHIITKGSIIKNGYSMGVTRTVKGSFIIYLDRQYQDWLYNKKDIIYPLLFHEVGHIVNKDYLNHAENNSELRVGFTAAGVIQGFEKRADQFAASIVGKQRMIKSLQFVLENRIKNSNNVQLNLKVANELRIEELKLRIQELKENYYGS